MKIHEVAAIAYHGSAPKRVRRLLRWGTPGRGPWGKAAAKWREQELAYLAAMNIRVTLYRPFPGHPDYFSVKIERIV